jgi:hypothetical protein
MHWTLLSLVIAGALANPVDEEKSVAKAATSEERDEKFLSVFQIVKFNNDACEAVDGTLGTCYTAAECTNKGGEERGNCASGFGVCCVAVVDPCNGGVLALNNSYIVNPGFPLTVSDQSTAATCGSARTIRTNRQIDTGAMYEWTIKKAASDIVQLRLDFIYFETSTPMMGDCTNDTFVISGADPVSMKNLPTNLCGILTGQHLYVSIKSVEEVKVGLNIASIGSQRFQILVRQFDSTQLDYLAPRGCLQYFRNDVGTISTFNNQAGMGELLNNQLYSSCIAQNDAYCDISLQANNFELTGSSGMCSDAVVFGLDQQCGSTFGVDGSLLCKYKTRISQS